MVSPSLTGLTDRFPASVPLLPVPERLTGPLLLIGLAVLLAGLDLLGALAAKAWAEHRSLVWFAVGLSLFGLLFWVYGSALRYTELAAVTIAWIVVLQVAVVLIDRFHNGVQVSADQWLAVAGILALEGYLLLGPSSDGAVA